MTHKHYVNWFLVHGFKDGVGEILGLVQTLRTGTLNILCDHFSGEDVDPDLKEAIDCVEEMGLELVGVYRIEQVVGDSIPACNLPLPTGMFKEF